MIQMPKVTLNILPATQEVSVGPQHILFVGQKTSAGTATSGSLVENILNDNSQDTLFGADSMLAGMIRAAKSINKMTQMDAIPLSDAGGATPASGTVVFTGPATASGTIYITIGSSYNCRYAIAVVSGDSATTIGGKLATAITADTKCPVDAVNTTGSVALTAVNAGLEGNNIGLRVEGSVAGVTVTLTAFASGATNPTLTSLFDVVGEKRYQTIVWPSTYTLSILTDFLDPRFNTTNQVLDGIGITRKIDTYANLVSLGNGLNTQNLTIMGDKLINNSTFKGSAILELPNVVSSYVAAIRGLRLTSGADISRYVIATRGGLDSFGGAAIASFPYFNTPFSSLPIIPIGYNFTRSEIDGLTTAGISVLDNNITRTSILLGDVVTTYKTDSAGNPDTSFKYLNYVDTISTVREYMVNNLRSTYSQYRLTNGDLMPGRNMANEVAIRTFVTQLYTNLSGPNYVLTQAGEAQLKFFKENLSVSLDLEHGLVTINMITPIVTQLREIVGTIQIAFSTQALQ